MRLPLALAVAAIAACAVVPAAHAADRVARDFGASVHGLPARDGASAARTRTLTLRTRERFDLAGFHWRAGGRAARVQPVFRVQSHGRDGWSRWITVETDSAATVDARHGRPQAASEPFWTGPSDALRIRVDRSLPGLRVHFITIDRFPHARVSAHVADAAAPPPYVPRSQWAPGRTCVPRVKPSYGEVRAAVVHHTAGTNTYTQAQAAGVVLAICRFHRNGNGWNDIGYNALVDRFGTIYEGRAGGVARAVIGAHAQGYNGQTTGVALVGDYMTTPVPPQQLDSLKTWLAWRLPLAGVTRDERVGLVSAGGGDNRYGPNKVVYVRSISGHRDLDHTDCPGDVLYAQIDALNAALLTPSARRASRLSSRMRAGRRHSRVVKLRGRLRSSLGPVAGATVELQRLGSSGWRAVRTVVTHRNGAWAAAVRPHRRAYLRAYFDGDATLRPSVSVWHLSPRR